MMVKLLWYWTTQDSTYQYMFQSMKQGTTAIYLSFLSSWIWKNELASKTDGLCYPTHDPDNALSKLFFWVLISIFTAAGAFKLMMVNNASYLVIFFPFLWTHLHFHLRLCSLCPAEIIFFPWWAVRCVRLRWLLFLIGCFYLSAIW